MPFAFMMPKLSPTMESGEIVKWHKKVGDFVEAGDLIIEVATDKATVEHSALDAGFLRKILVNEKETAVVNQPIAIFSEEKDENIDSFVPQKVIENKVEKPKSIVKREEKEFSFQKSDERIFASPLAKKLANEKGIDLRDVTGSGPRGRIVSKDLVGKEKASNFVFDGVEETLTPIRKVIATRLQKAKASIPHFYVEMEVNAEPLLTFRESLKASNTLVSINDCIIKATALALVKHREVNSGFNDSRSSLIRFNGIDISVAVSIKEGLITPIVFEANKKSLGEISKQVKALAIKAKEGKLQPKEFQGGSFTISNLGMFGVSSFQGIINPPQGALLAVGAILDRPVVKEGQVVPGKVMHLNLSVDHRVIDGVLAAEFLLTLKNILENPSEMLN